MPTRSPGATRVTAVPTRSTTPAPSWPSTAGSGTGYHWSRQIRSVWQIPAAATSHEHLVGAQVAELELLERERRSRALGHRRHDPHPPSSVLRSR